MCTLQNKGVIYIQVQAYAPEGFASGEANSGVQTRWELKFWCTHGKSSSQSLWPQNHHVANKARAGKGENNLPVALRLLQVN